jgi:hypothetical protein
MKKSVLRVGASMLVLSLVGVACGGSDDSSADACEGNSKIAFFGALTGEAGNLGINIKKGLDLAVAQHNEANPDAQIDVEAYDSQGDPDQAPALADKAIADACVKGIVGPAFSGESAAVNAKFEEAGLPLITPSATNPALSTNGWDVFHRALAGDDKQGPGAASRIVADGKMRSALSMTTPNTARVSQTSFRHHLVTRQLNSTALTQKQLTTQQSSPQRRTQALTQCSSVVTTLQQASLQSRWQTPV